MAAGGQAGRDPYYHGWNVVAACILAQVATNGLITNSISLFVREWTVELHAPVSQLLLPVAAMTIVAALLCPAIGSWADRYPARWLFGIGFAGIALVCF